MDDTAGEIEVLGNGKGQYPLPMVDHAQARERTLARYAVVKANKP